MNVRSVCPLLVRVMVSTGVLAAAAVQAFAQTPARAAFIGETLKIQVNDPRPLARVVDELEQLCQCAITYEDARSSNPRDLVQVRGVASEPPTWIPRGGPFEFTYDGIITLVHQRVPGVLSALLHQYSRTRYPGRFTMTITGTVFHVLPAQSTDRQRRVPAGASLLDAPIWFESTERTMSEALQTLSDMVTESTGQTVLLTYPLNLLETRRLVVGADAEPARDVLLRILAASGRRLSWRLLYDAAVQTYALNVRLVPDR